MSTSSSAENKSPGFPAQGKAIEGSSSAQTGGLTFSTVTTMTAADLEGETCDKRLRLWLTPILAAQTLVEMTAVDTSNQNLAEGDEKVDPDLDPAEPSSSNTSTGTGLPAGKSGTPGRHSTSLSPAGSMFNSRAEEGSDRTDKSDYPNQSDNTQWNAIIPEASRTVPVGNIVARRSGRGRQAFSTPASGRVPVQQRTWRLWAMRHLLGEPVGITDDELRNVLVASGWDLGMALRRMNNVLNQARHRHRTNAPNRGLAEQQRDRLLGADSLHHNRRLGIDFLYTRLFQVVRADQSHMLTTVTLGQLLADHRFDIDEAVNAFLERLLHQEDVEHHQRMERRLRMVQPNQLHQDQRVARVMEIAGTDDYYAVRGLLQTHGYDMLRAMDHWMRHGLATQPIPPSELNRSLFRTPRHPHTDTEDLWPHPRPLAGPLLNIDADDLADAGASYDDPSYPNRNGWFVRYPRAEARVGINIPTRRRADYIRRGEFRVVQIDRVKRKNESRIRDPFDYNNSDHVQHLNGQATQWFRRIQGDMTKERGVFYRDDENEWIWWWHNEQLWEMVEAHPELLDANTAADWQRAGLRWPMRTNTRVLARDYNHRWTQQTHLPGMNGMARQERDVRSLDAQRRRIIDVCNDFGFPYSPPHPTLEATRKKPQCSPSSSDVESDSGDENNDEPQPRKKLKPAPQTERKANRAKRKARDADEEEIEGGNETGGPAEDDPVKGPKKGTKKKGRFGD